MNTSTISETVRCEIAKAIRELTNRWDSDEQECYEAIVSALASAHPAQAEKHGYKICFPYAAIGDMTPALFKDGTYYYYDFSHPTPREGETPETDMAITKLSTVKVAGTQFGQWVSVDFARSLELRLVEKTRQLQQAEGLLREIIQEGAGVVLDRDITRIKDFLTQNQTP